VSRVGAAWAWVLAHNGLIDRLAGRFARERGLDFDDVRSEVVLRLVERHAHYDPARSSASTWIWWSAREVSTRLLRVSTRYALVEEPALDLAIEEQGFEEVERASTIRDLLSRCSREQHEAARSVLDDLSREEVVTTLGCSVEARNARLYRIGRSLSRELVGGAA